VQLATGAALFVLVFTGLAMLHFALDGFSAVTGCHRAGAMHEGDHPLWAVLAYRLISPHLLGVLLALPAAAVALLHLARRQRAMLAALAVSALAVALVSCAVVLETHRIHEPFSPACAGPEWWTP
jgi:hypothetical protein